MVATAKEFYTCAACGNTYEKLRSDAEAEAESVELFGAIDEEDKRVVCDDCFIKMTSVVDPQYPLREGQVVFKNESFRKFAKILSGVLVTPRMKAATEMAMDEIAEEFLFYKPKWDSADRIARINAKLDLMEIE